MSAAAACIALVVAGCAGNSPGATGTAGSGTPSNGPTGSAGSGAPSNGPTGSAGSSTGTYGFPTVTQDPTAKITVWVDADRSAIAEAFQKDHPECPLAIETYDASAGGSDTF
ncbi:MAG: hypothetical protein ACJ78H_04095, partial [Chloroflexota bacterium]